MGPCLLRTFAFYSPNLLQGLGIEVTFNTSLPKGIKNVLTQVGSLIQSVVSFASDVQIQ